MRALWQHLSDPSLHLLAIALVLIYLALGVGLPSDDQMATSPLGYCNSCHTHYMPGGSCACQLPGKPTRISHALP